MAGNKSVMLLFATLVLVSVFENSSAKTVVVGGSTGWTIPSSPSFYPNWTSQQNLQVGDVLVFNFPAGGHTVAEVSKANYDSCTTTNTIGQVMTTPPVSVILTKPGTQYFICTVPGHCSSNNQKLAITVAAAATPSPTLAPKSSPSSEKTPPPASSPTATVTPLSPTTSTVPMGPTSTSGDGTAPPPADNFATSTVVGGFSLVSAILAFTLLF